MLCPFSVSGGLVTRSKASKIGSVSEWLKTLPPESTKTGECEIMKTLIPHLREQKIMHGHSQVFLF